MCPKPTNTCPGIIDQAGILQQSKLMSFIIKQIDMKKLNRRSFIGQGTAGLGALLTLSAFPEWLKANGVSNPLNQPIGFQTYPIRDLLVKDFPGTLKIMAEKGYQLVEMCSPSGY